MKPIKDDHLYLEHILDCIGRIENYTRDGHSEFLSDTKVQDAVLRNLQILAESTGRLSVILKASHPSIDWRAIASFRNVLVHDYLGINPASVWQIVEQHLPDLKMQILAIRANLKEG